MAAQGRSPDSAERPVSVTRLRQKFDAPAVRPAPRETDGEQELPALLEAPSPDATPSAFTPTSRHHIGSDWFASPTNASPDDQNDEAFRLLSEVEVQRLSAGKRGVGSGEKERENAQPFIVRNLVDFQEVDVAVTPKQRGETARLSREALIDRASFGVDQLHMICVTNGHCPSLQIWHNYTLTQRMMWALSFSVGEIFRPQALPGVGKGLGLDTLYSL